MPDFGAETGVLHLVLIRPTHYGDDGYPIRWLKSVVPSNSLACLNGLAEDAQRRQVLGPGLTLRISTYDEVNCQVRPARIIRTIRRAGGRGLVCFVGVQSNQFPRALDLARPLRAAGLPVCIGGFHVSGCIAMLPELTPELREAQAIGISLFAGEAEGGSFDTVLRDAWQGELRPLYNYMNSLPGLEGEPAPFLPRDTVRRTVGMMGSIDLGRGCPYQCSFCTIINVQGRKSRYRSPDDLEDCIRRNADEGIHSLFITDDNLARNRNWESLLDRMIELQRDGQLAVTLGAQVDTLCHRIPGFIEKSVAAGVRRVFIGLENINPDNLIAAKKRQNRITEYRAMLQAWRDQGVITWGGYILGFPGDTADSIRRDVEIIKRELPIDILDFFILTPLPGSEDHQLHVRDGKWLDADLNKFDTWHRVSHHPTMSDAEWDDAYDAAWQAFYSTDHVRTILRRAAANPRGRPEATLIDLIGVKAMVSWERVHPLESGFLRRRARRERRPGLPLEGRVAFHLRFWRERAANLWRLRRLSREWGQMLREAMAAPDRWSYVDRAIAPPDEAEFDELDLFSATSGGVAAVAKKRRDDRARAESAAAAAYAPQR